VDRFRQLMLVVFASGAIAGLVLFAVRQFTVIPLIQTAETYEAAAQQAHLGLAHDDEGWQPANGWERTSLTALTTILTSIGFAAILFGLLALTGTRINGWRGALWGLAAFVCFVLAPALGLPPQPPGAAVAGLYERQVWWAATAVATATGLWLAAGRGRTWLARLGGLLCLALPHMVGAPAASEPSAVPAQLVHRFAAASVATNALFWLVLGAVGGLLSHRATARSAT